jgi:hypothetical protein
MNKGSKTVLPLALVALLMGSLHSAFGEQRLTGSELLRAEKCAGDYVCYEGGMEAQDDDLDRFAKKDRDGGAINVEASTKPTAVSSRSDPPALDK